MGFDNVNVNVSGPVQPTSTYKTKVLKGNHSFASQVTEPNTKYVIKHDFDLGGETVTIPANCVLEFDGGSLSNGRLQTSNNVYINNPSINEVHILLGDNNTIEGGVIHNENCNCIEIEGKDNIVIRNSTISTTKGNTEQKRVSPIYIKDSSNISIHGCAISGSKWKSYGDVTNFYQDPACCVYAYNVEGINIEECEVSDSIYECIYIVMSTYVRCQNNYIHDVGYSCIADSENTYVTITGNNCYNSGASCITAQSDKFIISNNIVHNNNSGNGITAKHSTNTAVQDIDYTSGVVCGNIIYDFVNAGIASSETSSIIIAENDIHDGRTSTGPGDQGVPYGVRVRTDEYDEESGERREFIRIKITNNVIRNVYGGIYCNIYYDNESETIVSGNTIANCNAYGVSCNKGRFVVAENNFDNVRECVSTSCSSYIINNTADNLLQAAFVFNSNLKDKQIIIGNKVEIKNRESFYAFIRLNTVENTRLGYSLDFNIKNNTFISKTGVVPVIRIPNNSLNSDTINSFCFTENHIILNATLSHRESIINYGEGNNISLVYLNNKHNDLFLATDRVQTRDYLPIFDRSMRYYPCYVEEETALLVWRGFAWVYYNNLIGTFAAAESLVSGNKISTSNTGIEFFVSDKKKPIYYGGDSKWYDYDGAVSTAKRSGDSLDRPIAKNSTSVNGQLTRDINEGFIFLDKELRKPIVAYWISTSNSNVSWIEFDGAKAGVKRFGTKAERQAVAGSDIYIGFQFMQVDTPENGGTLPLWVSAISGDTVTWVDATGATV